MYLTESQVLRLMRRDIGAGSQAEYAAVVGVSPQLICDVLHGRRNIPERVLARLSLVEQRVYRKATKTRA